MLERTKDTLWLLIQSRVNKTLKVKQSMSGKGNCYDNLLAESFFGKIKTEYINHEKFKTREEAKSGIFEYTEIFYNRERRHSSINYLSPVQFESLNNISKVLSHKSDYQCHSQVPYNFPTSRIEEL